jgi:hypothetical protein
MLTCSDPSLTSATQFEEHVASSVVASSNHTSASSSQTSASSSNTSASSSHTSASSNHTSASSNNISTSSCHTLVTSSLIIFWTRLESSTRPSLGQQQCQEWRVLISLKKPQTTTLRSPAPPVVPSANSIFCGHTSSTLTGVKRLKPHLRPPPAKRAVPWCNIFFSTCRGVPDQGTHTSPPAVVCRWCHQLLFNMHLVADQGACPSPPATVYRW